MLWRSTFCASMKWVEVNSCLWWSNHICKLTTPVLDVQEVLGSVIALVSEVNCSLRSSLPWSTVLSRQTGAYTLLGETGAEFSV